MKRENFSTPLISDRAYLNHWIWKEILNEEYILLTMNSAAEDTNVNKIKTKPHENETETPCKYG
jgi:hypothetical protein